MADTLGQIQAVKTWNSEWKQARKEGSKFPECEDCIFGTGGGFNVRVRTSKLGKVCAILENVDITKNEADKGGTNVYSLSRAVIQCLFL